MNGMPITMLNGFGCACESPVRQNLIGLRGMGAVSAYDVITIGGQQYSVNQILDKTVIAKRDTPIYSKGNFKTPSGTIKAGQPIGKVYSYLKPSTMTGGKSALMFYTPTNTAYYAFNESVDTNALKDQGTKTVQQEVKEEAEKKELEDNPVGYYLKKYGYPALLIIGGIIIVGGIAKEAVKGAINKKTEATTT